MLGHIIDRREYSQYTAQELENAIALQNRDVYNLERAMPGMPVEQQAKIQMDISNHILNIRELERELSMRKQKNVQPLPVYLDLVTAVKPSPYMNFDIAQPCVEIESAEQVKKETDFLISQLNSMPIDDLQSTLALIKQNKSRISAEALSEANRAEKALIMELASRSGSQTGAKKYAEQKTTFSSITMPSDGQPVAETKTGNNLVPILLAVGAGWLMLR